MNPYTFGVFDSVWKSKVNVLREKLMTLGFQCPGIHPFGIMNSMSSEDFSGRILSHYRIIKLLGAGGMGEVYLAQDTHLDRTVALKILPAEVASDEQRMRRFVREAKAASAIDHPNIVHVYEINQADGVNFIAMQYVEGETLRNKINRRPLLTEELLQTAIQMTDAIAEAHARGIIHRDLKPVNIMISNKGDAKLLDFGLARIDRTTPTDELSENPTISKTESGSVMGTVAYMSPEQALGKEVDHRTDIFSAGVVLYEMATARQPFSGANPSEVIDKIVHSQPESIRRLNYDVPQELERIIRKCLEKDRENRYQSASEILVDLKNLKRDLDSSKLNTGQQILTPVPRTDPMVGPRRSRNYWIPVALLLIAFGIATFAFYWMYFHQGKEIRALAVLPFKNASLDPKTEYLSDGITDSIINNISLIKQIRVMARGTVFTYKNKEVDPRQVGKDLGVDGVVTGKLLQEGDSLIVRVDLVDARDGRQIWGEQYDRKLADLLSLQSQISKEISDKLRIKLSEKEEDLVGKQYTENTEAYQLYLKGQFFLLQRTPDSTKKAMDYFRNAIEKDPSYALAYDGLADCYNFLGITGALLSGLPPKEVMPKAKELARKAIQLDETLAQPHRTLAHIHANYDFDWEGAEREFNRALELNPNDSHTYALRALFFISKGQNEEAFSSLQRFKELDPGVFPGRVITVGLFYYWARQYDNAIQQLQIVNEMAPNFPNPYFWLGAAYLEKKDYNKALEAFQKAVTYSHRAPVALSGLGIAYARAGNTKEGEGVLAELLEASKKRYVPEFFLACLYGALGRKDEAFGWLDKAYQERANGLSIIRAIPLADDLRSDPRFSDLLERLKLN